MPASVPTMAALTLRVSSVPSCIPRCVRKIKLSSASRPSDDPHQAHGSEISQEKPF